MTLTAGTKLGRYEIRSKIGEGGMGEVYLAQDMKLDRKVALKILPADVAAHPDRMRRFVQEAKAASALNHPNIITIYEIDETDSGHFIATEFIDGETLRERALKAPLRLADSLEIATQIAAALAAAHGAGIVHRDIKPENVMLRRDGIVKVLDFGLAKLTAPESIDSIGNEAPTRPNVKTDPGMVMGTPIYMSPEQARGLPVDARTDVFSLGIVLYEMVAGRLPFEGSNRNEIMASVLSDKEPQPLTRYSSEAPNELGRIVLKALRKNRDERYQTIKDLLLDLQSLKQELEFERKLERSESSRAEDASASAQFGVPPSGGRTAQAKTGPPEGGTPNTAAASSAEYIVSRIKQNRLSAVIVICVLLVVALGTGFWLFIRRASTPVTTIDSIAVLPFENATHDQNNEYLSDGVTESLINSLSQLPHVKVIGRNSVFSYKGQTTKVQDIARQLNVRAVLTGRVLMQGDMLDVRAELTDAQSNAQLWGDHYTRKAADIFAVQDEIARQVTDALRVRLTGTQEEQVTKRYTENTEAYQLYLQGRYLMNQQVSEEDLKRAVSFFNQAIALDPHYSLAYAARGESVFLMGDLILPMKEAVPKGKQDSVIALSIDPGLADARNILANIEYQYDWNFARAEEDFKQVIASTPNYAEGHHSYAWFLALMGRPREAITEMNLAQQLDPVNPQYNVDLNLPYYLARQYDQSMAHSRKALEMFPNLFLPHMTLGQGLVDTGDFSKGIGELEKAKAMEPTPLVIGLLGYAYAKAGRKDEARKVLADLKEQSKTRYVPPYWIALIYTGLNEKDDAFAWLEKAYQDREYWLVWLKTDPKLDSLRSDARFADLMRRIGFPN
jgi:serine/threonine protein kinase/Tfp pilus assembly protein PilF